MEIFKLFGSIMVDNKGANESLDATDKKAEKTGKSFTSMIGTAAKWGAGVALAAGAAGAALFGVANKAAATTDRIDKLSQKIGLSRQGFQEWEFILSQSGTDIEKLQVGLKTMVQRMDEVMLGTGKGAEYFERLGVSVTDSTGALRSQEEVFEDTVRALQAMPEGAEKARLASELFGRAGLELMPLLNDTTDSIDNMKKQAQDLGLVLSDDAVDAGVLWTDTVDQMKRMGTALFTTIGTQIMPIFQTLMEWVIDHMPQIQKVITVVFDAIKVSIDFVVDAIVALIEWFKRAGSDGDSIFGKLGAFIKQHIQDIVTVVTFAIELMQKWWAEHGEEIMEKVSYYFGIIRDIVSKVIGAIVDFIQEKLEYVREFWEENGAQLFEAVKNIFMFIFNIIKVVFDDIMKVIKFIMPTIISILEVAWDLIKGIFNAALDIIMGIIKIFIGIFTGDWKKAWEGVKQVFMGVWDAIVAGMKAAINLIITGLNTMIRGINKLKIKIPDWVPGFGGKEWGINIPEIPKLAKGGDIWDDGAVMVGEEGPEILSGMKGARVTPLNKTDNRGTVNVIVELDGRSIVRAIGEPLVEYVRVKQGVRV